jgi:hypothetical protein
MQKFKVIRFKTDRDSTYVGAMIAIWASKYIQVEEPVIEHEKTLHHRFHEKIGTRVLRIAKKETN